jgi:hypothetical protein
MLMLMDMAVLRTPIELLVGPYPWMSHCCHWMNDRNTCLLCWRWLGGPCDDGVVGEVGGKILMVDVPSCCDRWQYDLSLSEGRSMLFVRWDGSREKCAAAFPSEVVLEGGLQPHGFESTVLRGPAQIPMSSFND